MDEGDERRILVYGRSDVPHCSSRSKCQVKALLHGKMNEAFLLSGFNPDETDEEYMYNVRRKPSARRHKKRKQRKRELSLAELASTEHRKWKCYKGRLLTTQILSS